MSSRNCMTAERCGLTAMRGLLGTDRASPITSRKPARSPRQREGVANTKEHTTTVRCKRRLLYHMSSYTTHWKVSLLEFLTTGNSYYWNFLSSLLQSSELLYVFLYNFHLFKISKRTSLSLYFSFFSLQITCTRSPSIGQKKRGGALLEEFRFYVPTLQFLVTRLAGPLFLTVALISIFTLNQL